jgi:hypothetical protein
MGEIKSRSVRLDDENYGWLNGLPGRTFNEAVGDLRASLDGVAQSNAEEMKDRFRRIEGMLAEMPGLEEIQDALREVVLEFKGQKVQTVAATSANPLTIPGVQRGVGPPKRETGAERAARERFERQERARALDKTGGDRDDVDRGDEYVSN